MERLNDIINRAAQRRQHSQDQQRAAQQQHPYGSPRQPQGQRPSAANQPAQPTQQPYAPSMPQIPPTPLVQQTRQMPAYRHTRPASEQRITQEQRGMPQGTGAMNQGAAHQGATNQGAINHAPTSYPSNYTQQMPPNRSRYTQEEQPRPTPQIAPHLSQSAARPTHPAYPRPQRLVPKTPSPYPLRQRQEERGDIPSRSSYYSQEQASSAPSTYSHGDYQSNPGANYHAPLPADVLEEEDDAGMQYGDWEDDGEDASSYQQLEPETHAPVPPRHTYTPASTVREPYAAYAPEVEPPSPQARHAQEMYRPPAAKHTPITHIQEVPNYHNKTQPLDPASVRFTAPAQEPSRQLVTRAALTPAPISMQMTTKTACPKCKGAGYRRADVPYGHPNFGKPIACECKEAERKEKRRQQLVELSDLSAFHDKHFDNFNTRFPGIHPSVVEGWKEAYHFAQNPKGWLVFIGTNGCGKTHLASAIANQCLNDGMMVLFSVVPELLDHLRSAFAPTATQVYDQLFSKMREAELLVLDDLGAHYSTPWATEKLYQLLNYRYSWSMPTVITTNNVGLQSIDIRLSSRMMDSSLVTIINLEHAKDRRPYLPRRDM